MSFCECHHPPAYGLWLLGRVQKSRDDCIADIQKGWIQAKSTTAPHRGALPQQPVAGVKIEHRQHFGFSSIPSVGPEPQHGPLPEPDAGREHLYDRSLSRQVGGDRGGIGPTLGPDGGHRRRPHPQVVFAAPIGLVVTAFVTGQREVGDLVALGNRPPAAGRRPRAGTLRRRRRPPVGRRRRWTAPPGRRTSQCRSGRRERYGWAPRRWPCRCPPPLRPRSGPECRRPGRGSTPAAESSPR